MLRKVVIVFLILFLIMGTVAAFTVYTAVSKTDQAVIQPIGELVRQLVIPVTPAILPDPATILQEVNDEARLITVSSEYEKIIRAQRNQEILWGALGETMIFVAHGTVVSGIDLNQMSEADIQVLDPDTVQIHLPPAQIFDDLPVLDNEKSYVADRDTGLLTRADADLETQVRQIAEQEILAAAQDSGILERADFNAQQEMLKILKGLGFENIIFMAETPPTAPPYEQEVPKGYAVTPAAP